MRCPHRLYPGTRQTLCRVWSVEITQSSGRAPHDRVETGRRDSCAFLNLNEDFDATLQE